MARGATSVTNAPEATDPLARLRAVRGVACAGLVAGMVLSWRLWSASRFFPVAPPFDVLPPLGPRLDTVVALALLISLCAAIVVRRSLPLYTALGAAAVLALGDQTRWQPWFYQYIVMLIACVVLERREKQEQALDVCRAVVAGIYFWSGLQKLNPVFLQVGLTAAVGEVIVSEPARTWLIHATPSIPFIEAGIGLALLHPRTRAVAMCAAVSMHALILLTLGPLGRSWNSVVWPWNLAMSAFGILLFRGTASIRPLRIVGVVGPRSVVHVLVVALFWLMPAASLFGAWDSYLSAALYSQNLPQAALKVSTEAAARLPEEIRNNIEPDSLLWLQDWSLADLNATVYPEPRVFKKVARAVCEAAARSPDDIFLIVASKPDLLTGERDVANFRCDELR